MEFKEAEKIFKDWQNYQEIADKMSRVFVIVPESFLPHPVNKLEEALNIITKYFFDSGDKIMAENIRETMGAYLIGYFTKISNGKVESCDKISDEEALQRMKKSLDMKLENQELKETVLKSLKECSDSWLEFRIKNNQ
jgi:hypothetical protein